MVLINPRTNQLMFQAQHDAGGDFGVRPVDRVPCDQLWLVGGRDELMGKITIPSWKETTELAQMLAEAICFTNQKKRTAVRELWVNTHALDALSLALQVFADPEQSTEEDASGFAKLNEFII